LIHGSPRVLHVGEGPRCCTPPRPLRPAPAPNPRRLRSPGPPPLFRPGGAPIGLARGVSGPSAAPTPLRGEGELRPPPPSTPRCPAPAQVTTNYPDSMVDHAGCQFDHVYVDMPFVLHETIRKSESAEHFAAQVPPRPGPRPRRPGTCPPAAPARPLGDPPRAHSDPPPRPPLGTRGQGREGRSPPHPPQPPRTPDPPTPAGPPRSARSWGVSVSSDFIGKGYV